MQCAYSAEIMTSIQDVSDWVCIFLCILSDDDDCTQVDTEDTYEDDEGNTFIITSTTYEGNCLSTYRTGN